MSPSEAVHSVEYIIDTYMPKLGISSHSLTLQYLGGEILTIPFKSLSEIVNGIRNVCAKRGIHLVDGVQTNLIASTRRVNELSSLFNGRVGSSAEYTSNNRTVNGSADKYMTIFESNVNIFNGSNNFGIVFTADATTISSVLSEYAIASERGHNFTFRLVYEGGKDVSFASPQQFENALSELLDVWFLKGSISVEPLFDMIYTRLQELNPLLGQSCSGCNRQADCASRSVNIEPNGDLYVCMEMADAGLYKIGNALSESIDPRNWALVNSRRLYISTECKSCPYFTSCQGGCMVESIQQNQSLKAKTPYCTTYKGIFRKIDKLINDAGVESVYSWLIPMKPTMHNEGSAHGF